jgi:phosphate transport system substrate-binding protein
MAAKHKWFISFMALLLVLPGVLSACGGASPALGSDDLQGTITISGAFALYPMMQRWAEEFHKLHPGVQFDISAGGAGKGMTDALAGAVDIGMVSREISPEEEAKGAFWVPVVKDAVFPMVNAQNPVAQDLLAKGVDKPTFEKIFITGEITNWGQVVDRTEITDAVDVYTRSDACGAADAWSKFLGKKQEDLQGVGVFGDPGLLDAVIKDPLGIGYNNLGYAFDNNTGQAVAGSVVLPIDVNGNGQADPVEIINTKAKAVAAVANGDYPAPPARPLNLVTKDKPSGLIQAFIDWILTDGQKYVAEAGYVSLPAEQLTEAQQKIK